MFRFRNLFAALVLSVALCGQAWAGNIYCPAPTPEPAGSQSVSSETGSETNPLAEEPTASAGETSDPALETLMLVIQTALSLF